MSIKYRLLIGAILLATIPAGFIAVFSVILVGNSSHEALEVQAENQLVAIREAKRLQIEDYFRRIHNQVIILSESQGTLEALEDFQSSYDTFKLDTIETQRQALAEFYKTQFKPQYNQKNPAAALDEMAMINQLDDTAVAMQYHYIQNNHNPFGSKQLLNMSADGSDYSMLHRHHHPFFRSYVERFDFYDCFLVDAETGRVLYSVFKKIDFGTSLKDGPFADSGIGKAYRMALSTPEKSAYQSEYSSYRPSFDDQAAFVSTPVVVNGVPIGVIIFQLSLSKINEVMTSESHWAEVGLGKTGETYLVGGDKTLRNNSRFQIEDPQAYLHNLKKSGIAQQVVDKIAAKGSGIGLQPVNNPGAIAALAGEKGYGMYSDYRGIEVLSAYTPVAIEGLNWALISEIDADEAFAAADKLEAGLVKTTLLIALAAVIFGSLTGLIFSRRIAAPLLHLSQEIKRIGENVDLRSEIKIDSNDELGDIARSLNAMFRQFRSVMGQINESSQHMLAASEHMSTLAEQTRQAVDQQHKETDTMAASMEEMSTTSQEVANSTTQASAAASDATHAMNEGTRLVSATEESINVLAREVKEASEVISQLKQDSEAIGGVLDVIRSVAEQTNLLALNAAIEAARAGDLGRGFAVVADEVRTLASRTQESTEEIQTIIAKVQSGADGAVKAIKKSRDYAESSVDHAVEANASLQRIGEAINRIGEMSHLIASAAEEQSAVSRNLTQSVYRIVEVGQQTGQNSEDTAKASASLNGISTQLKSLVNRFKV